MKIIHISPSALAGAPGMLSNALEDYSLCDQSIHFRAGDHGPDRNLVSPDTIPLFNRAEDRSLFSAVYEQCDIVHVHNYIPKFLLSWIAELGIGHRKFLYQVHSPVFERPIYDSLAEYHGISFDHKLVICHFHPRQHPDYEIVPNCLYRRRSNKPITYKPQVSRTFRITYSPSTLNRGRWTEKTNEDFEASIRVLEQNSSLKILQYTGIAPQTLDAYRSFSDITIDEVVTGSFHLVSYEGLAAGTVVINGADDLSIAAFQMGFDAPIPPFVRCGPQELVEKISLLTRDRDALEEQKRESMIFFKKWMHPKSVAEKFVRIYER